MGQNLSQLQYHEDVPDCKAQEGCSSTFRILDLDQHESSGRSPTEYKTFIDAVAKWPDRPCFGQRERLDSSNFGEVRYIDYKAVAARVHGATQQLYANMSKLGVASDADVLKGEIRTLGILAPNCPEWLYAHLSANALGITTVPIYPTLGVEAIQFIGDECSLKVVAIHEDLLSIGMQLNGLEHILLLRDSHRKGHELPEVPEGISIEEFGRLKVEQWPVNLPEPDETESNVTSICYTSGTTGSMPKGVIIRNGQFTISCRTAFDSPPLAGLLSETDVHMSYLPLAHIYERCNFVGVFMAGGSAAFWSRRIENITEDIRATRPTFFCAVPRLLNKIYDKIAAQLAEKNVVVQSLVEFALNRKIRSETKSHWLYDVIFNNMKKALGGRVRFFVSASASLDKIVQRDLTYIFGAPIYQAYGMTETCGVATMSRTDVAGTIGGLVKGIEARISSWETYDSSKGSGELFLRGSSMTEGYFKNLQETKNLITDDGFLRTGDIVNRCPQDGSLSIVDRRKCLLKLGQGEYVSPDKVEGVLGTLPHIDQIVVDGLSSQKVLLAIVVLEARLKPELGDEPDVVLLKAFEDHGKKNGLMGFEIPKGIIWAHEPLTIENGCLTPTAKVRRPIVREIYSEEIKLKYADLNKSNRRMSSCD